MGLHCGLSVWHRGLSACAWWQVIAYIYGAHISARSSAATAVDAEGRHSVAELAAGGFDENMDTDAPMQEMVSVPFRFGVGGREDGDLRGNDRQARA